MAPCPLPEALAIPHIERPPLTFPPMPSLAGFLLRQLLPRLSRQARIILTLTIALLPTVASHAEECWYSVKSPVQPDIRLDINDDGTVTDIDSGLTWMRCSLGQEWTGESCRGELATMSWSQAQQNISEMNDQGGFADFRDWRLPRLNELATIVDLACKSPRVNTRIFPDTPAAGYWSDSSTSYAPDYAYMLSFGGSGVLLAAKSDSYRVRLVRGRE